MFGETGRKEIAAWEVSLLLEGVDLTKGRRRKQYSLPAAMMREDVGGDSRRLPA